MSEAECLLACPLGLNRQTPPSVAIQYVPVTRFQQIVDPRMRQSLLRRVILKSVAVKTRESSVCAKPEITSGILSNTIDVIVSH